MNRFFLLIVSLTLSCQNKGKSEKLVGQESIIIDSVFVPLDTTVVDYTNDIPITKSFVVSRDSVIVRQAMSTRSKAMEKAGYGEAYEVIGEEGDWLAVWSRERYPYEGLHNGEQRVIIAKRKVFIPRSVIGKVSDLKLSKEDALIISFLQVGEKEPLYNERGLVLKDFLSLELITEQEFRQQKKGAVEMIVRDTLTHVKKEGVLVLPATIKNYVFKDSPIDAEENRAEFEYVGYNPSLQQYIVNGSYYESIDYTLVDMHTGEQTVSMVDFPHFSPDGRHIIALYTNPYEDCVDVELYRIVDRKITPVASFSFVHWMAGTETKDIFFTKDNSLYLPVFYNKTFWTEEGQLSTPKQFMRITIK
ncbi:hypothetical protein [Sphingobacterium yanglingense]|uniref:Uncharacterized protein n=1 Tax=Sphingobacterium yanglingense TaxID=1437280 RepID=A0A4R6W886_9SPHI|nr:hypothetical protein [Sphingobacterium yanglingense]TDQ75185.1 hypothetical protein CLV99_3785 [Sphingobacterium yanglingense]